MFRQSSKVQSVNSTGFTHANLSVSKIQKRGLLMKGFGRWGVVIFFSTICLAICPSPKGFAQDDPPQAYIALGESTDFGTGATAGMDWVTLFHTSLFGSSVLRNYSVFGATMGDIRRDQLADALSDIASFNPVVVSLGGGGNDLLNFINSPQAATCRVANIQCFARLNALLNNVEVLLDQMVRRLRAAGPNDVILLRTEFNPLLREDCEERLERPGISLLASLALEGSDIVPFPVPFLTRGLNDRIRDVAARYNAIVIEIFDLFLPPNTNDLIIEDCIHTNDAGHEIIFNAAKEAFGP
jgi:lysophospholipase L1-like esterase